MVSDFSDYCCNSLENENTLAIWWRKHVTEAATERCPSNLCLAAIIKIIEKCLSRSQIWKNLKWTPFQVHFKGFHPSCKTVMLGNSFSLKHLLMATGNFWTYCDQGLARLHDIKKKCSENFIDIFLTVKTEWPNVWVAKNFSDDFKSQIF